jgi:hypothetical protein
LARTLTQQFSDFMSGQERRARLCSYIQGAFLLGSFYKESRDDYIRFTEDDYWRGVRPRPKPDGRNVFRSVLALTMRTKEPDRKAWQNRIYKWAPVLEYFYRIDVISDEVPQRLKDGGGIDAIYAALCRSKRLAKRGYDLEETIAALPLARTGDGATDDEMPDSPAIVAQGQWADRELDIDDRPPHDDGRRPADDGRRKAAPRFAARNEPTDRLTDQLSGAGRSIRGPLNSLTRKTILEVEVFEFELEEVLSAKRITIRAIVDPRDGRGWSRVVARSVWTSNNSEGPWPGQSPAMRNGNE